MRRNRQRLGRDIRLTRDIRRRAHKIVIADIRPAQRQTRHIHRNIGPGILRRKAARAPRHAQRIARHEAAEGRPRRIEARSRRAIIGLVRHNNPADRRNVLLRDRARRIVHIADIIVRQRGIRPRLRIAGFDRLIRPRIPVRIGQGHTAQRLARNKTAHIIGRCIRNRHRPVIDLALRLRRNRQRLGRDIGF